MFIQIKGCRCFFSFWRVLQRVKELKKESEGSGSNSSVGSTRILDAIYYKVSGDLPVKFNKRNY